MPNFASTILQKIPTHYCTECGSKSVEEMHQVTHSCSREDLEFIFNVLLPDLTGKTLLDVGSRFGAVMFGAGIFSNASKIIGIEMNPDMAAIAQKCLAKFCNSEKFEVVCAELSTRSDIVTKADVIVLNNVFDWFSPVDIQVALWHFLKQTVKSGTLIVTVPSLEESLTRLPNCAGISIHEWVTPLPVSFPSKVSASVVEEKCENIKLYVTK